MKIDKKIAEFLEISVDTGQIWSSAWEMMERRVKGGGRVARPGAEPIDIGVDREDSRRRRRGRRHIGSPLDFFFG